MSLVEDKNHGMIVNALVFARLSSKRLPGKVLKEIGNNAIIDICINKLKSLSGIGVIVSTSNEPSDDPIVAWCIKHKVKYFRGDLNNVAKRTIGCLNEMPCDFFFRINADSPFLQPSLMLDALNHITINPSVDIVTNVLERSYPYGIAVELINSNLFTNVVGQFDQLQHDHEHITQYFYRNKNLFRIKNITCEPNFSNDRWVIDTLEDWEKINSLYSKYGNIFNLNVEQLHQLI